MGSKATEIAVSLCKKWEGLAKRGADGLIYPYLCPAGYWTIGYGTTRLLDGSRVSADTKPITEDEAEDLLYYDVRKALVQVAGVSPILAQSDERLAALTSFVYNLGIARYVASTLRKRVDAQDWLGASIEIRKWVWGGGKRLPGLVKRRNDEAELLTNA